MEELPIRSGSVVQVVGNNVPFMRGAWATRVAAEAYRVLQYGGAVRLSSRSGTLLWREYLVAAGFRYVQREGMHMVGHKF